MRRATAGVGVSVRVWCTAGAVRLTPCAVAQSRHFGNGITMFALGSARGAKKIPRASGRRSRAREG